MKNAVMLYDSDCPMCKLYTNSFVQCGLLDANGRVPYAHQPVEVAALVNQDRARNEIALVDLTHKKVWYGLDSLVQLLFGRFPFLIHLIHFPLLWYPLKALYKLISYNRRVIAPRADGAEGDCAPDLHRGWRLGFIVTAEVVLVLLILKFWREHWLMSYFQIKPIFTLMLAIHAFQFVVMLSYVKILFKVNLLNYAGNLTVTGLCGALLLFPVAYLVGPDSWIRSIWFLMVYCFMLWDHRRRDKIMKVDITATGIWVLYRVFLLLCFLGWKFLIVDHIL